EFAAEEGDAAAAINAFGAELEETGQLRELTDHLTAAHLTLPALSFSSVPADAPRLRHVMEEFHRMIEAENIELLNGWGVVIITQNQQDLKRIDIIINWQDIVLEDGRPVLDSNGQPIPVVDDNGRPVRRTSSKHIFINENSAYFD